MSAGGARCGAWRQDRDNPGTDSYEHNLDGGDLDTLSNNPGSDPFYRYIHKASSCAIISPTCRFRWNQQEEFAMKSLEAVSTPSGGIGMTVIRKDGSMEYHGQGSLRKNARAYMLKLKAGWLETCTYFRVLRNAIIRPFNRAVAPEARLFAKVIRANGEIVDMGLIGMKVVTTVGVNFIADAFQNLEEVETFNYHDSGTGATAEAVGDTALVTKVETGRTTGTQGEGASANIYQTVGTISYTATRSIVEHGIFSATPSGGTLLDRTVFASIGVDNGDSIQFTYELTLPAGS